MPMVNMAKTPDDVKKEIGDFYPSAPAASTTSAYPYGLSISFDDETLKKLGMAYAWDVNIRNAIQFPSDVAAGAMASRVIGGAMVAEMVEVSRDRFTEKFYPYTVLVYKNMPAKPGVLSIEVVLIDGVLSSVCVILHDSCRQLKLSINSFNRFKYYCITTQCCWKTKYDETYGHLRKNLPALFLTAQEINLFDDQIKEKLLWGTQSRRRR